MKQKSELWISQRMCQDTENLYTTSTLLMPATHLSESCSFDTVCVCNKLQAKTVPYLNLTPFEIAVKRYGYLMVMC